MFKYYLTLAFRNMAKRKLHTVVNIIGLAIGLTSFILIALYLIDEMSYDKHHSKAEQIYRVITKYDFRGVGEESSSCPAPVGSHLLGEYPDMIGNVVRFFNNWGTPSLVTYDDKQFKERRMFFTDSTVFEIFDIPFVIGNPGTALNEPGSVVITESTARRYFGDEDPIGKTLEVERYYQIVVSGVIEDTRPQSHFTYDMLISMSTLRKLWGGREPQTWVWNPFWTYVLLKDEVSSDQLDERLPEFVQKYFYDAEKANISLYLQPLTDIHLKSDLDYEIEPNGNVTYIRILGAIAAFLLIIAFINYVNLSTAMAGRRSKEIGIKKVFGSYRRQLIFQFITESVAMSIIGLIIALAMVEFLLPYFNDFTGKNVTSDYFLDPNKLLLLLLITILSGIVSGLYPAFYLSSFQPVRVLRGDPERGKTGVHARRVLVILQFSISIILIVATIFTYRQLTYMRNASLGFTTENILFIPVGYNPINQEYDAFKANLLSSPDVISVTHADYIVGTDHNTHEFRPEGFPPDQWQFYPALIIGDDFIETFDIQVVAGRGFSKENPTDAYEGIMINEAMVKYLGWNSNEEALGKKFRTYLGREKVIGVFKDFHATSLHAGLTPFVLSLAQQLQSGETPYRNFFVIRHAPGKMKEVLAYAEKIWDKLAADRPFDYLIHEQELEKLYHEEVIMSKLSGIFTLLVIFIASLGLFGLASYSVDQRTKEIGIRRVLGASALQIFRLLTQELNTMILLAILIAWPFAYFLTSSWLNQFSERVRLDWKVFFISALIALVISLFISIFKAVSSYRVKPAEILKYE